MWEIREGYDHEGYGHKGGHKPMHYRDEVEEAYECGYEEGYHKAMKEMSHYSERRMKY
jgi:hypothetical protein